METRLLALPASVASGPIPWDPIASKILAFAELPKGWHYGKGGPITQRVIDTALMWNRFLAAYGVHDVDASPSERGSILLAANIARRYTEIICEEDGTFTVTRDQRPKRPVYRSGLSKKQTRNLILQMMGEPWSTFAGSIHTSFCLNSVTSGAMPSRITQAPSHQDSPSWTVSVSVREEQPFAPTL